MNTLINGLLLLAIFLGVFSIATIAKADGVYFRAGIYNGDTDYSVQGDGFTCIKSNDYGCTSWERDLEKISGPFGKVEIGYREGNVEFSCWHLSDTSTKKDSGFNLCGIGVVFGR